MLSDSRGVMWRKGLVSTEKDSSCKAWKRHMMMHVWGIFFCKSCMTMSCTTTKKLQHVQNPNCGPLISASLLCSVSTPVKNTQNPFWKHNAKRWRRRQHKYLHGSPCSLYYCTGEVSFQCFTHWVQRRKLWRKEGRKEATEQASCVFQIHVGFFCCLWPFFLSSPHHQNWLLLLHCRKSLPRRKLTHPACPFCRRPCKVTYIHRYMFLPQVLSNWGCWKKSSTQACWDEESLAFSACRCWELWLITPCRTCAREEAWWRIGARCKAWLAAASRMLATAWWHWKHN